ncbi:MAG: SdiA-regulated domain-containing protein [Candidatus Binatia bacterium]
MRASRPRSRWSARVLGVLLASPFLVAGRTGGAASDVVEWPIPEFSEPSGIVYHPQRNSLFIVGDEGAIGEVSLDGRLLRQFHFSGDLEAVTVDPRSGLLYVVREAHEIIFEIRPDNFKILRRFTIDRSYNGDPNFLRRGGDGIEGLTFVPDENHPEGGSLWAVNQFDPPVLVQLDIALRTSKEKFLTARIARALPVDSAPLSGLAWEPGRGVFLVTSSLWKRLVVLDAKGEAVRSVRLPAFMPEGISPLPDGRMAIAQDSGGLVIWEPGDAIPGADVFTGPPQPAEAKKPVPAAGTAVSPL